MKNHNQRNIARTLGRWAGLVAGTVEEASTAGTREARLAIRSVPEDEPKRHDDSHFEHSDINARGTFLVGVGVLVGTLLVTGLLYFYFAYLAHRKAVLSPPPLPAAERQNLLPPQPRLQPSPSNDLSAIRASEQWQMSHYFWIDKSKGIVAIPVERAIDILAQRGIPPQKAPANLALSQPQAGTRETGFERKVEPEPQ